MQVIFLLLCKIFNKLINKPVCFNKLVYALKIVEGDPIVSNVSAQFLDTLEGFTCVFYVKERILRAYRDIKLSRIAETSYLGIVKLEEQILPGPIGPGDRLAAVEE